MQTPETRDAWTVSVIRMRRTRLHSLLCIWAAVTTAVGGCRAPTTVKAPTPAVPATATATSAADGRGARPTVQLEPDADTARLKIGLPDPRAVPDTPVSVTALDDATTAQLLARLPALPSTPATAPAMRPPSAPPPRSGPVEPLVFFAATGKAVGDAPLAPAKAKPLAPLAAPMILPIDEVEAESTVRVRFAEPMIPIAKVGEAVSPPVTLSPNVPGMWRWLDTHVLELETDSARLPKATTFTVTVPAGTTALSGARLETTAVGTFRTRPLQITEAYPRELRPDGAVAIGFDQALEPARVATFLKVTNARGARIAFKVIEATEALERWRKDPSLGVKDDEVDRQVGMHRVLIAPATAWPAGSELRFELAKGAPSAEGPLVTTATSSTDVEVVPAFTVRGFTCGFSGTPRMRSTCPANNYGSVVFSNEIDVKSYRSSMVQLEGTELEDHNAYGNEVGLSIPKLVGRTFTIRIDDGLVDTHGQPLVGAQRPAFTTTREVFEPYLRADSGLAVLDPRFTIPQWVVHAQAISSLRVQLYRVTPADYFAYEAYESGERATPPGTRVFDKVYAVGTRGGMDLRVDLRPALGPGGLGHVIAIATPADKPQLRQRAWLQVTKLAIAARIDGERIGGWIQDLSAASFLSPPAKASAQLLVDGRAATPPVPADAYGHVSFEPPAPPATKPKREPTAVLAITSGDDISFTAISQFQKTNRTHEARWYVTDDRFTYKPGEKVYVKGWVRWTHDGPNPDLALPATSETVAWQLVDTRGNKLASGSAPLTEHGGFDLEATLPATVNLGTAMFSLTTRGATLRHPIAIQEFRTPAFSVTLDDDVTHAGTIPLVVGERLEMQTTAAYYAGGGLRGAGIRWTAELEPAAYSPPGWDLFVFSPPRARSSLDYRYGYEPSSRTAREVVATHLTAASTSTALFDLAALHANRPSVLTVDATVTDVDRQRIRATSRPILVHPSSYYVGLRKRAGDVPALEVIVTDIDGEPVAGVPVEVTLEGVLGSERTRDDANVIDTQACKLVSAATAVVCPYTLKDLDTAYLAAAKVTDARGRTNRTQYQVPWWRPADAKSDFWVTPDRPSYKPGDTARLEIHSTLLPATALITFARQGRITEKRVQLKQASTFVDMSIDESFLPNVHVVVDRLAANPRAGNQTRGPLPIHQSLDLDLPVEIESARLVMKTRPTAPIIEPGANATFEVQVQRADQPVAGAEVALVVVDEAVLALSDKHHGDPLPGFYRHVGADLYSAVSHKLVRDAGSDLEGTPGVDRYLLDEATGSGHGGGRGGLRGRTAGVPSVRIGQPAALGAKPREDFRANAVFSPRLRTDASGKVRVTVKMPDSLTRYRIVALAASGPHYFGMAESTVVAQRKLNARTQVPRFLTQGDAFSLPVVVQNLDPGERTIDVAVRAANLASTGPMGKRLTLAGGQRAEVRFDFATRARGKAVIQTVVVGGATVDASQVEVPVYAPATTESFATYGIVDDGAKFEQLAVPRDVFPDVGGVEVEVASTQLQALTDAYWYLHAYPHECAEQRSSRMLATAAVFDVLEAFATPGKPTRQDIEAQRDLDVKKLAAQQNGDGGFGYFRGMESDPFVTMQVASALVAIQHQGPMRTKALAYVNTKLASLLAAIARDTTSRPNQLRREALRYDVTLAAAGLGTLARSGVDVTTRALRVHAQATSLGVYSVEAKARMLALLAGNPRAQDARRTLLAQLASAAQETASAATVTTQYVEAERLLLVSDTRTTALALDAFMREAPAHPLIPKLARGLLDGRRRGRWTSTQDNLAVMQALRRYFDTYEKVTPNFTGKLWLGKAAYAEQAFAGRSTARAQTRVDWTTLAPGSSHDVAIAKEGPGRMYYRVGITYAPQRVDLPALDAGFVVRRTYTPIDSTSDVTKLPDGRLRVKLGARVLVTIETLNTTLRHAVAVVDPMPAGFEAVNAALAIAERPVSVPEDTRWDFWNLRDERSEAFAMRLDEGTHRFSYTARATTPGTFVAAPAKAEEMYSPETFGRSTGVTVVIE